MSFAFSLQIPVLNGMPFLSEMLASLEAQSFRNFSTIIWDNGSTDGSVEEAMRWIPSRLPGAIVSGRPLPLHLCRSRMVEEAQTDLCALMDADDVCMPDRFQSQLYFMQKNSEVALLGMQIQLTDLSGKEIAHQEWSVYPTLHDDIVTRMMQFCPMAQNTLFFRRDAILNAGGFSSPKPVEDVNLYLKVSQKYRMQNLPSVGSTYRKENSTSVCSQFQAGGLHEKLVEESLLKESYATFRIRPEVLKKLKAREKNLACIPLLAAAMYRSNFNVLRAKRMIFSPWFLKTARAFTCWRDRISWRVWRTVESMEGQG